nr:hypothetical protein [Micromonospora sp. DSM 115978]
MLPIATCETQGYTYDAKLRLAEFAAGPLLGLEARDGQITVEPEIPPEIGRLRLVGVNAFGRRWEIEADGTQGGVRLLPAEARLTPEPPR